MERVRDWLDARTGFRALLKHLLDEPIPQGVGWWFVSGSVVLFLLAAQLITGIALAFFYSPSPDYAYDSVRFIMERVTFGGVLRGLHFFGASFIVVAAIVHMLRVVALGSYKKPRELNWIVGVLLLATGMLAGFTGYLLPWDQTAYWATVVGINLNGTAPVLGPFLAQFLSQGAEIGANTLSMFYALHMLVIPGALFALIGLHLYLVIRLGVSSPPWSPEAAGRERAEPEASTDGRAGLVRPAGRGGSDGE